MSGFEKLFDELDQVDDLLTEGPGFGPGDSEKFLREIQSGISKAQNTATALTIADVDSEFTEDNDNGEESNEPAIGGGIGAGIGIGGF